jgi:hypothetical protein
VTFVGKTPVGILLFEDDDQMVAILELEWGKNLIAIHTLRNQPYAVANFFFEFSFDRFK